MPVFNRTPYRNLILTGTVGVGKTSIGRQIAAAMEDAHFIDFEVEIHRREGYTPEQIRQTFGVARLRSVENKLIEEMTLRRSSVIALGGMVLLDPVNLERMRETGPVMCLTASLGEILRRMHVTQGGRFHDLNTRSIAIGRLKRESDILKLDIPQLDTTNLSIEKVAKQVTEFWLNESDL